MVVVIGKNDVRDAGQEPTEPTRLLTMCQVPRGETLCVDAYEAVTEPVFP